MLMLIKYKIQITNAFDVDDVDLMIDLRQADGNRMTWTYYEFKVYNQKYWLHIGEAESPPNGHVAMAYHNSVHMIMTTMV